MLMASVGAGIQMLKPSVGSRQSVVDRDSAAPRKELGKEGGCPVVAENAKHTALIPHIIPGTPEYFEAK